MLLISWLNGFEVKHQPARCTEKEDSSRSRKMTVTEDLVDRLIILIVIYPSQWNSNMSIIGDNTNT